MSLIYVDPTPELLAAFQPGPLDQQELDLSRPGVPVIDVLQESILNSEGRVLLAHDAGKPVSLFGLAHDPRYPTLYMPWMLSSARIGYYARACIRYGRQMLRQWRRSYPTALIGNYIYSGNSTARSYIRHMGGVIVPNHFGSFDFFFFPETL